MQFWLKKKMPKMISKKVYISRGGGVDPKVYIFFKLYFGKIRIVICAFLFVL